MNSTDCIRITIANQPNFENRVLAILRNRAEPLSISDFENEYMNRYDLAFSPLIRCSGTKKAIILSTLRNYKVFSEVDPHPVLGHINVLKIMHNQYKKMNK